MAAEERTQREMKRASALVADGVPLHAAMRTARAEIEREGRLVDEMNAALAQFPSAVWAESMRAVVAAYEAEFAPQPRTVEQIAADVVKHRRSGYLPFVAALDELAAALGKDGK